MPGSTSMATRAWLAGADPWVHIETQRFAAPPPTLIPLAPIAILPRRIGVALMVVLAVDRRRRHGPAAPAALVVAPLPAVHRRGLERQPAEPARAADPGRCRADRGVPQDLRARADGADPALAGARVTGIALLVTAPVPAMGFVHRPVRRPVHALADAVGRWPVRDRDPVAHPGRADRARVRRSRARGLAVGPGAVARDAMVLLDARAPGPDSDRRRHHRRPDPGRGCRGRHHRGHPATQYLAPTPCR